MAKQYHRRESGLIVADDALIIPKSHPPRPWWATQRTTTWKGMSRRKCCCTKFLCEACLDANRPSQMSVVISGLTNVSCVDCTNANGTWIIDYIDEDNEATLCNINYYTDFPETNLCGSALGVGATITVQFAGPGTHRQITVYLRNISVPLIGYLLTEPGETDGYDCMNFSSLAIPWVTSFPGSDVCGTSLPSALLSAA